MFIPVQFSPQQHNKRARWQQYCSGQHHGHGPTRSPLRRLSEVQPLAKRNGKRVILVRFGVHPGLVLSNNDTTNARAGTNRHTSIVQGDIMDTVPRDPPAGDRVRCRPLPKCSFSSPHKTEGKKIQRAGLPGQGLGAAGGGGKAPALSAAVNSNVNITAESL